MVATTWNDVVKAVKAKMPDASLKEVLKAASPEWKRIKSGKNPTKGMASLTMSGKEDFSTKKTSKVFHRKGHYEDESVDGVKRRPYHTIGKRRSSKKPRGRKGKKAVSKLPMSESVLMVEESPMAGGQAAADASPEPDQAAETQAADVSDEVSELAQETTGSADPSADTSLVAAPGMPTDPIPDSVTDPEPSQDAQSGGRRRRRRGGRRTAKKSHRRKHRKGGRRTAKKSHHRRHRK